MAEPVTIILLTRVDPGFEDRSEYALRCIESVKRNLVYPDLAWYVADGGSLEWHLNAVLHALESENVLGYHSGDVINGASYGGDANIAYAKAKERGNLTLWLEDDWTLTERFDLWSYAALLMEEPTIGMVRMGYLNLNMRGSVFGHGGQLYWRLDRTADSYVFTGHPSLRHSRFMDACGPYPERLKPGETELAFALQYRSRDTADIAWPVRGAEYGFFGHIGTRKSYQ